MTDLIQQDQTSNLVTLSGGGILTPDAAAAERRQQRKGGKGFKTFNGLKATKLQPRTKSLIHNPIVPNMADILPWMLYDNLTVAAGQTLANTYMLFTQPVSGTRQLNLTNLPKVSELNAPEWMNLTHAFIYFAPTVIKADIENLFANSYGQLWIGDKYYASGPLWQFPSPFGLDGFSTATNQQFYQNGGAKSTNLYDLRLPEGIPLGNDVSNGIMGIPLLSGQALKFIITLTGTVTLTAGASGGGGLNLYCGLPGILSRGVQ
jgi:hypothetical protein